MAESSSKQREAAISIRDGDIKEAGPPAWLSVLQRVPAPLRENEKQKHIYDPVTVPLGPYHHGRRPEFHLVEKLKEEVLDMVCGDRDRAEPLSLVSEWLPEIREFYGGADGYGDEELAAMMLRDTCFVLCFIMGDFGKLLTFIGRVGVCGSLFMRRDLFMLENQIPFAYGDSHGLKAQLLKFLVPFITCSMETTSTALPWVNDRELPLHLLEASQRLLVPSPSPDLYFFTEIITGHETPALLFNNMYLPVFRISSISRVLLSNLVAYELSSDRCLDMNVVHYVGLMKTLLRGEEDVELLREMFILYSSLANGEVVRLFQDIDTCGLTDHNRLNDVKKRIEEHCSNKGKTWLAELSPLTKLALLAGPFILALTFLQTFYTINPRYANAAP